ncbi:tRNA-specific 2-thiouridylase [Amanita rubescens]|nr:tRNA-specific 2-thiouridylase [Amanita rubescens]
MAMTSLPCLRQSVKKYLTRCLDKRNTHTYPRKGDKLVVAMSGGVDSSVAARLLVEEDYDLSAVYMRNWDTRDESGTDGGCEWEKDWEDVQRVCRMIDIPCKMVDLSRDYWNKVFEPSLYQWEKGITPNPDVWCNKEIKFGALLECLPANPSTKERPWFATGHYAKKDWSTCLDEPRPRLLRGAARNKDQSYYLSSISEDGLRRSLFPLGHLNKLQVRELARKYQLPTAQRPESMGICFVGEKARFSKFLSSYIPPNPGPIYELSTNKVIGNHLGLWNYTIGENVRIKGMPARMFVAKKDISNNAIYVVPGTNNSALYFTAMRITGYRWIWADMPPRDISTPLGLRAHVRHRYRMEEVPCTVFMQDDPSDLLIEFDEPQKAVAPGQVGVLYDSDWCLGCGYITYTLPEVGGQDVSEKTILPPGSPSFA